jgi:hypothetical protein
MRLRWLAVIPLLVAQDAHATNGFHFSVSAFKVEDGVRSEEMQYFDVSCSGLKRRSKTRDCELTVITVNDCIHSSKDGKKLQWPKAEFANTERGDLAIEEDRPGFIRLRWDSFDPFGQARITLRFAYNEYGGLTSFSGGMTKDSALLKRVVGLQWEGADSQTFDAGEPAKCGFLAMPAAQSRKVTE